MFRQPAFSGCLNKNKEPQRNMKKQTFLVALLAASGLAIATPQIDSKQVDILLQYFKTAPEINPQDLPPDEEIRKDLEQNLLRNEVFKQEAVKLGLDKLPDTQALLKKTENEVFAVRLTRYLAEEAKVDEQTLRDLYFKQNRLVLVQQVAFETQEQVQQAYDLLRKGLSFDELLTRFPNPAHSEFNKLVPIQAVPVPWQNILNNLKRGEVTREPLKYGNMYFIIKLAQEELNEQAPSFDKQKDMLRYMVTQQHVQERLREILKNNGVSIPVQDKKTDEPKDQ